MVDFDPIFDQKLTSTDALSRSWFFIKFIIQKRSISPAKFEKSNLQKTDMSDSEFHYLYLPFTRVKAHLYIASQCVSVKLAVVDGESYPCPTGSLRGLCPPDPCGVN